MRRRCWWILCLLLSCLLMLGSAAAEETAAVVPTENILVAQSDSLLLYFNEDYTKFRLVDGLSGREWYSYMLESQIPEGERVNRTWKNRSQSLVLLHYTDAEANTGEVVTSDLTAAEKIITPELIDGGIRLAVDLPELQMGFALELRLQGRDLVAAVPFESIREEGVNVWTGISMLPFLGVTNDWDEGYFLYPNDCGELYYFKDEQYRSNALVTLTLPVYAQHITAEAGFPFGAEADVAQDNSRMKAMIPAFGVKVGEAGFAAVVENGDAESDIVLSPAGVSLPVNRIYAKLNYRTNYGTRGQQVSVGGSTQLSYVSILTDKNIREGDRQVRYTFLNGENADYAGMAQAVRRSFLNRGQLRPITQAPDAVLDVFCAIEQQLVLTKEYMTFTTFAQAQEMVQYFLDKGYGNLVVNLKGWGDKGLMGYPYYVPASKALGGDEGLKTLAQMCTENHVRLQLQVNPMKLRSDVGGFQSLSDAARDGNDYVYTVNTTERDYYLQNMTFLQKNLQRLESWAEDMGISGFTWEDIGMYIYDDFSGTQTLRDAYAAWWRSYLKDGDAVIGGNTSVRGANELVREIPEESRLHHFGDESVPFYQMVMHGSVAYTGQPINLFYDDVGQVLRMIEYGYTPCFELTNEGVSRLSSTDYEILFSARFEAWENEIAEYAASFQEITQAVGTRAFTDHRKLAEEVYESTFETVKIIVNYSGEAWEDVPAGSYKLMREE